MLNSFFYISHSAEISEDGGKISFLRVRIRQEGFRKLYAVKAGLPRGFFPAAFVDEHGGGLMYGKSFSGKVLIIRYVRVVEAQGAALDAGGDEHGSVCAKPQMEAGIVGRELFRKAMR